MKSQGQNREHRDFLEATCFFAQSQPFDAQLRPPDHTPSPESHNNQSIPRISEFGFFSSVSERDSSFKWSLPSLASPELVKAKWFFPSRTHRLRCLALERRGSGVSAQVPVKCVNFLSLWLKLVSLDQQFDVFPLWCHIHVSTFNISD